MNNDNIIKESIQKMKAHVMWKDNDQSLLERRLRELLLEVEQAGYARAMVEVRGWAEKEEWLNKGDLLNFISSK